MVYIRIEHTKITSNQFIKKVKWHAYIVYAFKTSYSSSIYVKLEI